MKNMLIGFFHSLDHFAVTFLKKEFPGWAMLWLLPLATVSCSNEFHVLTMQGVKKVPFYQPQGWGWAAAGNMPIKNDASALLVVEDCSPGLLLHK